ncbi:hypothetical protein FRX31_013714 [Thalictrum thalictroides]|uniref:Uncharacterized protein n=1 Tax=Thalictrum thalictroides TaxID=46969 RepID=A0A7J6WGY1_THATH|nr:hypothetical protein FRX31_013714 [Thalictrum thalictroides]
MGLRLSKQLWPVNKGGKKNRFAKIKQLARQVVANEYQRLGDEDNAQQIYSEAGPNTSVCSVTTPLHSNQILLVEEKNRALIEHKCSNLKSTDDVNKWVKTVIGPIAKSLGLSSTSGDQAIKKFFTELGLAKLREQNEPEKNEDERERDNYEFCNYELTGKEVEHG